MRSVGGGRSTVWILSEWLQNTWPSKVKPYIEAAKEIFKGTGVVISTEGERYLGGAVGNSSFVRQYVEIKVEGWVNKVKKLSKIVETQPHAAYAAYTHGLSSKWNYLLIITDWEKKPAQ